jgi:hypothetical protein
MAGKSCFTQEIVDRYLKAIRMGATYIAAANYAGIASGTLRKWMKLGKAQLDNEQGDHFLDFYLEVKKAEGIAVMNWLKMIQKAAKNGNWQAAAWKLERRYPNEYGRYTPEKSKDKPVDQATVEERIANVIAVIEGARARKGSE